MNQPHETLQKEVILSAQNLHKSFYNPVKVSILDGVDLEVHRGETVAIMGRSGEGKSTLLHILGTLERPCKGTLTISGEELGLRNTSYVRNSHIGFVFQSFHLMEDYSVLENVMFPARIARKSASRVSPSYKRAHELLELVGLQDRAHFNAKQLSGGEKQRAAIARAMMNDPALLLADEPSGNLDNTTAESIHHLLLNFAKVQNKSLIVVTHDQALADLCDRKLILKDKKLLQVT